jgi:hypothetical protein
LGRIEADLVTGLSGREQILRRMRGVDVLLLLHGTEPICAEYIPSKLYEYLWMQRPILATVHNNPQMLSLLRTQGHTAVENQAALVLGLEDMMGRWKKGDLSDIGQASPYTTESAVERMRKFVE